MADNKNKCSTVIAITAMAYCCSVSSSIQAEQIKTSVAEMNMLTISISPNEIFQTPELSYLSKFNTDGYTVSVSDISVGNSAAHLTDRLNFQNNNDWRGVIMNSNERKVFEALSNPQWDFRTVAGIAREIGFNSSSVNDILGKFPQLIRHCNVPDKNGRLLYTLSSRPKKLREKLALLRFFITKSLG